MTTVRDLMNIEEILLKIDTECRYLYSFDELAKSEQYLNEIGRYTSLFFSVQVEYSKTLDKASDGYANSLREYNNRLISDPIDIDTEKYVNFIKSVLHLVKTKEYKDLIEKLIANEN